MSLEFITNPSSVAVIGASRSPSKIGYAILNNLLRGGFSGELFPVNPSAQQWGDRRCYPSLGDLGRPVDLCVIAVPADRVPQAVEDAIAANARAILVVSAGFKESGPEGALREEQIARRCRETRTPLLGPKSLGVIDTKNRLNASFASRMPKPGGIGVLSDSGAICTTILDFAAARGLGISKLVSIGNRAILNEIDWLNHFAQDAETKVVVGYLESISSGDEFIKAAEALSSLKPVVLFRAGFTQSGARAAAAHTGFRSGEDFAYAAAFKRAGVIRAEHFESLIDLAAAFVLQPLPRGDRVAVITNGGGPGVIMADLLEQAGFCLASLSPRTVELLQRSLPRPISIANPIDLLGDADPQGYSLALDLVQQDEGVDAVVVMFAPHAMSRPGDTARRVREKVNSEKPTLVVAMGFADEFLSPSEGQAVGLSVHSSPEGAASALRSLWEYATWKAQPPRVVTRFPVNRRRVDRLVSHQLRTGKTQVGEVRTKEILRAYGFNVPDGVLTASYQEAVEAAERLGFPVALKIISPDILHKSDVGGVKLSLSDAEQVRDAFELISLRCNRQAVAARIEGIYVEKMCGRGLELVIGMKRDPRFGPILLFGLGGIAVESLEDRSAYLAPITFQEAVSLLKETRSYALLQGAKEQSRLDLSTVARGLQRVSQLVTDFPMITELEINPFTVSGAGQEPVVVDAQIVLFENRVRNKEPR